MNVNYRKGVCKDCGAVFWYESGAVSYPEEEAVVKLPASFSLTHVCPKAKPQ